MLICRAPHGLADKRCDFMISNLSDAKIASVGAMVLVNSNFSSFEALTRSHAAPDNTPCVT